MEELITARQFALSAGLDPRRVQRWAAEAELPQIAGAYVATRERWEEIAAQERPVGRPKTKPQEP